MSGTSEIVKRILRKLCGSIGLTKNDTKHAKPVMKQGGIEFRGEHVFRHTFATNCYHKGIDVKILSRLLGHADVNVTYNTYVHLYGDGFDEMYSALVPEG